MKAGDAEVGMKSRGSQLQSVVVAVSGRGDKIEDDWVRPTCVNRTWRSNVRGSGEVGLEVDLGGYTA